MCFPDAQHNRVLILAEVTMNSMVLVMQLRTQTAEEMSSKHHSSPWARYHTTSECYVNARRSWWRPQEAIAPFPSICIFSPVFTMFLSTANLYDGCSLPECHPHKDTKPRLFFYAQWILICIWKSEIWPNIIHTARWQASQIEVLQAGTPILPWAKKQR